MRVGVLLLWLLTGCRQLLGFEEAVAPPENDGALPLDVQVPPDASACTELTASCATADVLRTCAAIGELPLDTACNWGCIAGSNAHCGALEPTGGAATQLDLMVDPALAEIALTNSVINTDTGAITGARPAGAGVMNGIGFEVRNSVAVFRFKKLSITGPVTALGARAVVLVANEDIAVSSVLLARGCVAGERSPAGFLGGGPLANGDGPGAGGAGMNSGLDGGGGGAGHGTVGGKGGNGGTAVGGPGGAANGSLEIPLLSAAGGSSGGGGADAASGGAGGAGGGAIQLISNTAIQIAGGINAGGCGGKKGGSADAGGGGGAGGTIVLEAPRVEIAGGIAVNGGSGGGGDNGADGADGQLSITAATGGNAGANGGIGGDGGALAPGGVGENADRGGGGGGAVGRIRITTRDGSVIATGFTSPGLGSATATAGVAIIR